MSAAPAPLPRPLPSLDPTVGPARLGDLLQMLIAHGDGQFVREIYAMVQYRIAWIHERDTHRCAGDVPRP